MTSIYEWYCAWHDSWYKERSTYPWGIKSVIDKDVKINDEGFTEVKDVKKDSVVSVMLFPREEDWPSTRPQDKMHSGPIHLINQRLDYSEARYLQNALDTIKRLQHLNNLPSPNLQALAFLIYHMVSYYDMLLQRRGGESLFTAKFGSGFPLGDVTFRTSLLGLQDDEAMRLLV